MRNVPKNETAFDLLIANWAEKTGGRVTKLHGHAMQRKGIPDLWVAVPSYFGWIETKMQGKRCTFHQQTFIEESRRAGCPAIEIVLKKDGTLQAWWNDSLHLSGLDNIWRYSDSPDTFFKDISDIFINRGADGGRSASICVARAASVIRQGMTNEQNLRADYDTPKNFLDSKAYQRRKANE